MELVNQMVVIQNNRELEKAEYISVPNKPAYLEALRERLNEELHRQMMILNQYDPASQMMKEGL